MLKIGADDFLGKIFWGAGSDKHAQTILYQPTNCVFGHFVGFALKGLKITSPAKLFLVIK